MTGLVVEDLDPLSEHWDLFLVFLKLITNSTPAVKALNKDKIEKTKDATMRSSLVFCQMMSHVSILIRSSA